MQSTGLTMQPKELVRRTNDVSGALTSQAGMP